MCLLSICCSKQLTWVIWAVLDERRELCKDVSAYIKRLLVYGAEMRIPARDRREDEDGGSGPSQTSTTTASPAIITEWVKKITLAGPVFVQETPQFWWSLSWGCRCRGGTVGLSQERGLWARLASWRWGGNGSLCHSIHQNRFVAPWKHIRLTISLLAGSLMETLQWEWLPVEGLASLSVCARLCDSVCTLWIIQLCASFKVSWSYLLPSNDPEKEQNDRLN